ncbi:MAG TPA: hypothetical protein VD972_23710 [Hyalangium sp.]|nr:hypothetical protein [Hyalangium sp.]
MAAILASGCTLAPSLPPDVVVIPAERPARGYEYALPAPLKGGPFLTYFDALVHACPRLMSLPGASKQKVELKRLGDFYVQYSRDDSTEYCAWIYYTPKSEYEISLIATPEIQREGDRRFCSLPRRIIDTRFVDEPGYPDKRIKYAIAIHSHPSPRIFTQEDIIYLVETEQYIQETLHDNGQIRLGMAAFFSREDRDEPSCDGFFQYSTSARTIQMWTMTKNGDWQSRDAATVDYLRNPKNGKLEVTIIEN